MRNFGSPPRCHIKQNSKVAKFLLFFRYIRAFWYGLRTRQKSARQTDYICYLTEWRDICLLRLFEGFLEAAPQMILQLYILTIQSEFIVERDWLTATSAIVSIISLSWAIVSYSQMLRLCLNSKIFSVFGYCFQISYRLLMVASRVIVLVLFASAFKFYIFVFIVGHSAMMFGWLCCIDMISRARNEGRDLPFLDKIFTFIVSIIYLFCFLNVHPSTTKRDISMYYCVVFIENVGLMAAWYPYRTLDGVLMYAAVGVVFGGFIVGLIFMLLYYRYFHPNEDITAGWLCCPFATRRPGNTSFQITDDALVSIVENGDLVIVNRKGEKSNAVKRTISASGSDKSIPLELIRPHSPAKVDRASNNREDMQISEIADSLREHSNYGTIDSSLASNCRSDRKRPSGEAQNGSKGFKKEDRNYHMGSQEDGAKHRWTARISKQTEFHRLYDQAGLLEEKGELANLHFGHEERLESIDNKSHDNSKHTDAELGRKVKWQVEVSRQPRDEARESLDASRLIEHQKSKDDSGIRFCGVSRRRKEREDWRWSLDEIDATKVKQSSRVAGQKQNYGHEDIEQEFIFSDTNLNSVERAPHLT